MHLNGLQPVITLYSNHFNGVTGGGEHKLSRLTCSPSGAVESSVGEWRACPPAVAAIVQRAATVPGLMCVARVAVAGLSRPEGDPAELSHQGGEVATVWVCTTAPGAPVDWLDTQLQKGLLDAAAAAAQRFNFYNPTELPRHEVTRGWLRRASARATLSVISGAHGAALLRTHLRGTAAVVMCFPPRRWQWAAAGFATRLYGDAPLEGAVVVLDDADALFEDPRLWRHWHAAPGAKVWALRATRALPPLITWVRYMGLTREGVGGSMADFMAREWRWVRPRGGKPRVPLLRLHNRCDKMAQIGMLEDGAAWQPVGTPQHLHAMPERQTCTICTDGVCNVLMDACRHMFCVACYRAHVRASRGNLCMLCRAPNPTVHHYNTLTFTPRLDAWMRDPAVPVLFVDTRAALPAAFVEYVERRWGGRSMVATLHQARDAVHAHVRARCVVVDDHPPEWLTDLFDTHK